MDHCYYPSVAILSGVCEGVGHYYCTSVAIPSRVLEVGSLLLSKRCYTFWCISGGVIVTVQALLYFPVYVSCGPLILSKHCWSLLLSKCFYTFWCI